MSSRRPPSPTEEPEDEVFDDDQDDEYFTGPPLTKPTSTTVTSLPPSMVPEMTIQARYNNLLMPLFVPMAGKLIDLKHQIFELTGVAPDHQKVKVASWPSQLGDTVLLSVLGLTANDEVRIEPRGGTPPTSLEVFITSPQAKPSASSAKPSALVSAYTGGSSSVPPPAGMKAGAGALKHEQLMSLMESLTPPKDFKAIFEAKYGTTHPRFFDGSFAEAVRAAQTRHRTIVVYLHFPHHEATFPFCVATLCAPALASFINDNFIFWLGTADRESDGLAAEASPKAREIIKTLAITGFPVLAVVAHMRGFLTILEVLQGVLDPDELLTRFMSIQENTAPLLAANSASHGLSAKEQERAAEARRLKEEQNEAYEASLLEDRMKNELKAAMEAMEAKAKADAAAAEAKAKAEAEAAERVKQEDKDRRVKAAQARLSLEPAAGPTATNIAFRLADGSRVQRRFLRSDHAAILFDYLDSAQPTLTGTAYQLVSTVPKRTLKREEAEQTLEALGFVPQAMLHVKAE